MIFFRFPSWIISIEKLRIGQQILDYVKDFENKSSGWKSHFLDISKMLVAIGIFVYLDNIFANEWQRFYPLCRDAEMQRDVLAKDQPIVFSKGVKVNPEKMFILHRIFFRQLLQNDGFFVFAKSTTLFPPNWPL